MFKTSSLKKFIAILAAIVLMPVLHADASVTKNRIYGADRYLTAVEISKAGWEKSENAVIATGEDFPDALCAAPLAKELNAPILLTGKSSIDSSITAELKRLGVEKVYIVGGTGVISQDVENKIKGLGISTERIYGEDRYGTSVEIAKRISPGEEIFIATGSNFADALSAAPIAAKKGIPVVLTEKNKLPDAVAQLINDKNIKKSYILGGTGIIDENVEGELPGVRRLWGADRYETNISILNTFFGDLDFTKTYVATGNDFPDALAGSALAPNSSSPIILTDEKASEVTRNFTSVWSSMIKELIVLGGNGAVSDLAMDEIITVKNESGNTFANLNNHGIAAIQENWIYFRNDDDYGTLYRMRLDGSNKMKLNGDGTTSINVVGDYVYYLNSANMGGLLDGGGPVCSVLIDGTTQIKSGYYMGDATFVYANDKSIYYNGGNNGPLYRHDHGETGGTKKIVDAGKNYFIDSNWAYYIYPFGGTVYKTNMDTGDTSVVIDKNVDSFNIYENKIYYIDRQDKMLYRTNIDGTGKTLVLSDKTDSINVTGGFIYYSNDSDNSRLYKVKTDGSGRTKITDSRVFSSSINVVDNTIFFMASEENPMLGNRMHTIKTDGSNETSMRWAEPYH